MSEAVPFGEREGPNLEFKQAEALENSRSLPRSVVAMLNARGGRIWVGVSEEEGRASAVQDIEDFESARTKLRNRLVDSIEPSPTDEEVRVSIQEQDSKHVLLIEITPEDDRRPYAALWENGRFFHRRVDDRVRFMTRDEVVEAFGATKRTTSLLDAAIKTLTSARKEAQKRGQGLWFRIQPEENLDLEWSKKKVEQYIDPSATGNRRSGWSFTGSMTSTERHAQGVVIKRAGSEVQTWLFDDGAVELRVTLDALGHPGPDLYPLALLEYPTSVLRMFGTILKDLQKPLRGCVASSLALFGIKGVLLRPYSPTSHGFSTEYPGHPHRTFDQSDLVVDPPLVFKRSELVENADLCAWRVLRKVYAAFGYDEEEMPREFDRDSGRLRIG